MQMWREKESDMLAGAVTIYWRKAVIDKSEVISE